MSKYVILLIVLIAVPLIYGSEGTPSQCLQPITEGYCRGSVTRFGFDTTTQKCIEFVYGGCSGNDNNFDSIEECQQVCEL